MVEYRILSYRDIEKKLFNNFTRRQTVSDCWRKVNGEWVIKSRSEERRVGKEC